MPQQTHQDTKVPSETPAENPASSKMPTFRRMSETPTTTTSQKCIAIRSNLYCNTPPICIAGLSVPLSSQEREILQCSSHLYRSTPPICIAVRLPFVSQCFWENLGGCCHRDVPHTWTTTERSTKTPLKLPPSPARCLEIRPSVGTRKVLQQQRLIRSLPRNFRAVQTCHSQIKGL